MFGPLGLKKQRNKTSKETVPPQSLYPQELREVSLLCFPSLLSMQSGDWDWPSLAPVESGVPACSGFLNLRVQEAVGGGGVLAGRAHTSTPGQWKTEPLLFRKPLLQGCSPWAKELSGSVEFLILPESMQKKKKSCDMFQKKNPTLFLMRIFVCL